MLHIGLPLGGVGLIIGFLLGIAIYADHANRAGVLGLSNTLLRSTQERIAMQVSAYLEPIAPFLLAHTTLSRGGPRIAEEAYVFAASVRGTPQIANVLLWTASNIWSPGCVVRGCEASKHPGARPSRNVEWVSDPRREVTARQDPGRFRPSQALVRGALPITRFPVGSISFFHPGTCEQRRAALNQS